MPLDALLGVLVAVSAAAGALVSQLLQSIWRVIRGVSIVYTPI